MNVLKNQIFLQAHIDSNRLQEKILKKICNKTILEIILDRLRKIEGIDKIILVTGNRDNNILLLKEANRLNLDFFCGSEKNILDRFYQASLQFKPENIIRVTGDNPLIDFKLINKGLKIFQEKKIDVLSTDRRKTFPLGMNFQIFRTGSLHESWQDNYKIFQDQNFSDIFIPPTKYLLEKRKFLNFDFVNEKDLSNIRLTVDYYEDFLLVSEIFKELYPKEKYFDLSDILKLFENRPELLKINEKYNIPPYELNLEK